MDHYWTCGVQENWDKMLSKMYSNTKIPNTKYSRKKVSE